jgi:UDP-N-acetylmuramate dehydrogenase
VTPALADYTTLGLGGPARSFVPAPTEADLIDAVRAADAAADPVLLIGGGSNLVISDAGFPGTVIHVNTRGIGYADAPEDTGAAEGAVDVTVAAGEDWDGVVAATVAEGLAGLESLSGIPGRAGATPIQNVGAYGREVAEVITRVRVYDRRDDRILVLGNEECSFAYRTSLFKSTGARYVVLDVTFRLAAQALSLPVKYAELAAELGVPLGERAGVGEVRSAVLKIRARKGMVLNPGDPDTRSAGSFFTNPLLTAAQFAGLQQRAAAVCGPSTTVPRYPADDPAAGPGAVKVPAAWLIERAGFGKGYPGDGPGPRISTKHTLALTNPGPGTTAALMALAAEITAGVAATFLIELASEPVLVGVALS